MYLAMYFRRPNYFLQLTGVSEAGARFLVNCVKLSQSYDACAALEEGAGIIRAQARKTGEKET